jgi:hypothetical protein
MRNSMSRLLSNVVGSQQSGLRRIFAEVDSKLEQGRRRVIVGSLFAGALLASQAQALQLTVAWDNSSSGATGFQVERSPDGTHFTQVATVASSSTSYTDSNLTSGSYWYRVRAYNSTSTSAYSNVAQYSTDIAPAFTTQPASKSAAVGTTVSFAVTVSGYPAPTIAWQKNGVALSGATGATLTLPSVTTSDAGTYTAVATNSSGSVVSSGATLTITGIAPAITTQPASQAVTAGNSVSFNVVATGTPAPTYQWRKSGSAILGATAATLTLASVSTADAADYSVVVTNSAGSVTSANATLTVSTTSTNTTNNTFTNQTIPGHLTNVSVQALPGQGNQSMTMNFAVTGATKSVLVRGIGPGLVAFTTSPTFSDPKLSVSSSGTAVASNDNWGGSSTLSALFSRVGAFPLATTSKDAALVAPLAPGTYSAALGGKSGGLAMVELYDADSAASLNGRISKVTVQAPVGTSTNVLIADFTVTGTTPLHLLVRAIGPSLGGKGNLADPKLVIYSGSTVLQQNDNWGGTSVLATDFVLAGASSLSSSSKDAAIDITLLPGSYTAVVSGVNSTTGVASVEFYELP